MHVSMHGIMCECILGALYFKVIVQITEKFKSLHRNHTIAGWKYRFNRCSLYVMDINENVHYKIQILVKCVLLCNIS